MLCSPFSLHPPVPEAAFPARAVRLTSAGLTSGAALYVYESTRPRASRGLRPRLRLGGADRGGNRVQRRVNLRGIAQCVRWRQLARERHGAPPYSQRWRQRHTRVVRAKGLSLVRADPTGMRGGRGGGRGRHTHTRVSVSHTAPTLSLSRTLCWLPPT